MTDCSLADEFTRLWEGKSDPPDVFSFLSGHDDAPPRSRLEVVFIDQFERWKAGCPLPIGSYIQALKAAEPDDSLVLELVEEEYGYLEENGRAPDLSAFLASVPSLTSTATNRLRERLGHRSNQDADTEPRVPDRIGRYEITGVPGRGAFGVVYRARDSELERDVAIKVPSRRQLNRVGGVDSFLREARVVAALDHPGIVPVYDFGRLDSGECYVVSKYVDGLDLKKRLPDWDMSAAEAAAFVAMAARAMNQAHRSGLVHRDVKPENILVDDNGHPHIVDFGLALKDVEFGQGGTFVGTPAYMSPEQARGEGHRVDARCDIYSLGVILYQLLTGERPHSSESVEVLLELIRTGDVRPPRELDAGIAPEIERICLKAMSRRVSDRYATADELASELEAFVADSSVPDRPNAAEVETTTATNASAETNAADASASSDLGDLKPEFDRPLRIVPRGLRAFDSTDADFFLNLIPGSRDRAGMPDSIRFWKLTLEQTEPHETFPVGLIYGSSGCGKSSFVRAGLIPVLAPDVIAVYVEGTVEAEARLLSALRQYVPSLSNDWGLIETIAALRRPGILAPQQKVVMIIDQFEQWLHGWTGATSGLVRALRQCDGGRVQAVVMVRDDFWMAATRFMRELEVPLVEGQNSASIDLLDVRHAQYVLAAYGRAFGALPDKPGQLSRANRTFLRSAVDGLSQDGNVICARLAVFAQMVRDKPWIPATLQQLGGTHGVGETFLDETFGQSAPPQYRLHAEAARALLTAMLPDAGTDIKRAAQSVDELRRVTGYQEPSAFEELIRILDAELRLIAPVESAHNENTIGPALESATSEQGPPVESGPPSFYQLTHDFLVPALRRWLTRDQRRTLHGRAALQLKELANEWSNRSDQRYLPTLVEFAGIRLLTNSKAWDSHQRKLMKHAASVHLRRLAVVAMLTCGVAWLGYESYGSLQAGAIRDRVLDVRLTEIPDLLDEAREYHRWLSPRLNLDLELESATADRSAPSRRELALRLVLLSEDDAHLSPLVDAMLTARSSEFGVIRSVLAPYRSRITETLWEVLANPPPDLQNPRLRAAAALAWYAPNDRRWERSYDIAARELVSLRTVDLESWMDEFEPVGDALLEPLTAAFHDRERHADQRLSAADAIARFAADEPERLLPLVLHADERQFRALAPALTVQGTNAADFFRSALERDPLRWERPPVDPEWKSLNEDVARSIEASHGMVTDDFIFVVGMPFDDRFDSMCRTLGESGYSPVRIRPYAATDGVLTAAIWHRDGLTWEFVRDLTAEAVRQRHTELSERDFVAEDLAGYAAGGETRYCAIWKPQPEGSDATTSLSIGLDDRQLAQLTSALTDAAQVPTHRHTFLNAEGKLRHCLILRAEAGFDFRWEMIQGDEKLYRLKRGLARRQSDVSLCPDPTKPGSTADVVISGVWLRGDETRTRTWIHTSRPPTHRKASQKNVEMDVDYIPVGIGAAEVADGNNLVTSIWHRPVLAWRHRADHFRRQANAVIALLLLGDDEPFVDAIALRPDPTLRSFIVSRCAPCGVSALTILRRLNVENDESRRRALLWLLAEFSSQSLSPSIRSNVIGIAANLYERDPDSGVHSAAERLLRRYDESIPAPAKERPLAVQSGSNRWIPSDNGHTLAVLEAATFRAGFRADDEYRSSSSITHERVINRRFAIATRTTTVEQFSRFQEAHPEFQTFEKEGMTPRGGPKINVNFYAAAAYCNWLSRQAGLPEDQWCYVANEAGRYGPGMRISQDSLSRCGYRLPTEGEWEFACRAGTETMTYFGDAEELFPRYAWIGRNSDHRAHPVGRLIPNDFGLFDMLGNGYEITHSPYFEDHVEQPDDAPSPRVVPDQVAETTVVNKSAFAARSGNYDSFEWSHTAPARTRLYADGRSSMTTFRVARTLP